MAHEARCGLLENRAKFASQSSVCALVAFLSCMHALPSKGTYTSDTRARSLSLCTHAPCDYTHTHTLYARAL
jgi:hypothetical protein